MRSKRRLMRRYARASRLRRRLRGEGGFTLVEVMVALGVILAAIVALTYTATLGFRNVAFARQRQFASGVANQTIEQVRALPFDTLKAGLKTADMAGDPNITIGGPTGYLYDGEPVAHADTNPNVVPLVPHIQPAVNDNKTAAVYSVSTYVTYYNGDTNTTPPTFRVTTLVTWTQSAAGAASGRVQAQSVFYSGTGCLKGDTHPFAAPCQPFFYADAQAHQGKLGLTGPAPDGVPFIEGISGIEEAKLLLSGPTSDMQIEQVSAVQGTSRTSGASIKYLDGSEPTIGAVQVTSGANNDPADLQPYDSASTPAQGSQMLEERGGGGTALRVFSSDGDGGTTISTTSASVANPCPDPSGGNELDQLPCGSSNGLQRGTELMTLQMFKGGNSLGTMTIASVGASPSADVAYTDRAVAPELLVCPVTSGEGCVYAAVSRAWGTVTLGGLPPVITPPGLPGAWQGYIVRATGLQASGTAEAGLGSAAPTVGVQGTIELWNGVGYTPVPLLAGPSVPLAVVPVDVVDTFNGKTVRVRITPDLRTGGTQIDDPAACITCTRLTAEARANSPILGTIEYEMYHDGDLIAAFTLDVDLGTTVARASYQPAPSG
jgi:type II secretory pathway pseudopilin PulG